MDVTHGVRSDASKNLTSKFGRLDGERATISRPLASKNPNIQIQMAQAHPSSDYFNSCRSSADHELGNSDNYLPKGDLCPDSVFSSLSTRIWKDQGSIYGRFVPGSVRGGFSGLQGVSIHCAGFREEGI